MPRLRLFAFAVLFIALFASVTPAHAEDTPAMALVRSFYDTLTATMKEGPQLGFDGRYKKLEPAVSKTFNLPLMARRAVGLSWTQQPPEDQKALAEAFARFSIATYASRFTKYDGERFEVLSEAPSANGGVMVETHLTPKGSDPVTLTYLVLPDETGTLRIMDVYLEAAISELATRRSEFGAVIKREGFKALIGSLGDKAQKMGFGPTS